MVTKRERESNGSATTSKKRQKVENSVTDGNLYTLFDADELPWEEVPLPDRLDDVGGFFGLEEIDGVEVVQSNSKGQVKFKGAGNKPTDSNLKASTVTRSKTTTLDDEWSGLSDDAPEKLQPKSRSHHEKEAAKEVKERGQASKKKKRQQSPEHGIQSNLPFSALKDEEDDGVDVSAWDSLGLSPSIQTGLSKLKFATPTPIQEASIPEILAGHNVIGKAATGSGKTLAFGIPILEHYLTRKVESNASSRHPIALILSPTRELAHQLAKHIGDLNTHTPGADARTALLTGGLSIQKQQRLLVGADIVIGTPGRVWEILSSENGLIRRMKHIKFLVVDEADRLLSQGHFKEAEEIFNSLDHTEDGELPQVGNSESENRVGSMFQNRQTLLFSATFHPNLQQKLAGKRRSPSGDDPMVRKESMEYLLRKINFRGERPRFIDVNPVSRMAERVKEGIVECAAMEKDLYLYALLLYHPNNRILVFTNSISSVRRLTQFLQNLDFPASALHSSMEQKARLRSVERFSSPSPTFNPILVATDVASRGLDIKNIDIVIHYHVPRTADTYVHRSGRTARAGAPGKSILICAPEEIAGFTRLVAKVHAEAKHNTSLRQTTLEPVELDRRIVARIRPRVVLSKRITESMMAKEMLSMEDNWLRTAAEELGVDYDSKEFEQQASGKSKGRGRRGGGHERAKRAGSVTKAELTSMKAELNALLSKRINVGVSERYITASRVDVDALLRGEGNKAFIGQVNMLEF